MDKDLSFDRLSFFLELCGKKCILSLKALALIIYHFLPPLCIQASLHITGFVGFSDILMITLKLLMETSMLHVDVRMDGFTEFYFFSVPKVIFHYFLC